MKITSRDDVAAKGLLNNHLLVKEELMKECINVLKVPMTDTFFLFSC